MPRQPRKSKRLADKQRQNKPTGGDARASEIFGLTPRRGRRETLTAATALERAEAAANLHDGNNESLGRATAYHHGASPGGSLGPSPHASRLHWTSEDGTDADDESGDDEGGIETKLPEIDTDDEGLDEDYAGLEPRSPEGVATRSILDFIASDEEKHDHDDETYVLTASEDEEEGLSYLLETGTLTPVEGRLVRHRLSTIRKTKARRAMWLRRVLEREEERKQMERHGKGRRPEPEPKPAAQRASSDERGKFDGDVPSPPHLPAMASGASTARRRPTPKSNPPPPTDSTSDPAGDTKEAIE